MKPPSLFLVVAFVVGMAASAGAEDSSTTTATVRWEMKPSTYVAIAFNPQLNGIELCRGPRAVGTIYYDRQTFDLKFKGDEKDSLAVLRELIDSAKVNTSTVPWYSR